MINTFLMFFLAALGLGILIFVHELGHYLMAKRAGMRVEVFSIGFGRPIRAWDVNGVKWQIGIIPFGGYVKIAGMEKKGSQEPHEIPDGFYAKSPMKRIQVAFMGPLFNILFAFVVFVLIWLIGGRDVPFALTTKYLGWVAKDSGFYNASVRPGDYLTSINSKPYRSYQDYEYAVVTSKGQMQMDGFLVDYWQKTKSPFTYHFDAKQDLSGFGFFEPAAFLRYEREPEFTVQQWSSLSQSGIAKGDRIVCVDGELIFSRQQLVDVVNEPRVMLTIMRGGNTINCRVPRLKASDIRFSAQQKGELDDWQHTARLHKKVDDLYFIPYNLNNDAVVEDAVVYLNEQAEPVTYQPNNPRNALDTPLLVGDKIIAVDGITVESSADVMTHIQIRKAQVIVQKAAKQANFGWKNAEEVFIAGFDIDQIKKLIDSIGSANYPLASGDYVLLPPVNLVKAADMPYSDELRVKIQEEYASKRASIDKIQNPKERAALLKELDQSQNMLYLGGLFSDAKLKYNPSPIQLFNNAIMFSIKAIASIFSGEVSPKHVSGPVAIVSIMKQSITHGVSDGLYILGVISINLAIFNLLPIPVLDGGQIMFAAYEGITKKRLSSKVMEKLIIPFLILIILLFIYTTYNDILKLIKGIL